MGKGLDPKKPEVFFMTDVECSGPIPGDYSLLSLGTVVVGHHTPPFQKDFYCEMKPLPGAGVDPQSMQVNGMDIEALKVSGSDPKVAMERFRNFVVRTANPEIVRPVLVSNGTFDYMWVTWYFHHFEVRSPFGPNSLDMKSAYFGMENSRGQICRWGQTTSKAMLAKHPNWKSEFKHTHNALDDAIEQAERFHRMLSRD